MARRTNSHPEVEGKIATVGPLQASCRGPNVIRTDIRSFTNIRPLVAAPHSLELRPRLSSRRSREMVGPLLLCDDRLQVAEEGQRGERSHLLSGRAATRYPRRPGRRAPCPGAPRQDARAACPRSRRSEPRAGRYARPAPEPSKTRIAARALVRDEARQLVDQLARILEAPRVKEVVAVEQVERRLRHAAASLRRGARRRDADVQRLDRSRERDRDGVVTRAPDERA